MRCQARTCRLSIASHVQRRRAVCCGRGPMPPSVGRRQECDARAEIMLENYVTTLSIEAATLIDMVESRIIPACLQETRSRASHTSAHGVALRLQVASQHGANGVASNWVGRYHAVIGSPLINLGNVGQGNHLILGPSRPSFTRVRPNPAEFRPTLAEVVPSSVRVAPNLIELGQLLARFRPRLARFCEWSDFRRIGPNSARFGINFALARPNLAKVAPSLAQPDQIWAAWTNSGQNSPRVGQMWQFRASLGQTSAPIASNLVVFQPNFAGR